ncbi:FAD-binding domain-containing protein [Desarmillaria tabescens]|uniref:FAD-binding domain-containing protein n=1 Tax=Armillaria tabescens TaxID=1929756 RepID=A0AA39K089_ARMTA|nr:FAD-binding domain-containing protein [Desarmillaria tabescens]KAK0452197.1 FAD-binding domain-containing protein [Desarmillaria tabescens]
MMLALPTLLALTNVLFVDGSDQFHVQEPHFDLGYGQARLHPDAPIPECAWSSLNATIGGRLQRATPYARTCFSASFDEGECTGVINEYLDPARRSDYFGAYINTEWETCQATREECALNWMNAAARDGECRQGAVPSYYIDVADHTDVSAAFDFSRRTGVPVVIKNTGHDYMGRSSGPGTLGIWTHHLKSISYEKTFVPQGCEATADPIPAVTFGSGAQFSDLLAFANENNLTIPGGSDATVGVGGGYLQGGGHSPLSNIFGLAVDRVLEFEIVVPTGDLLIANECQNPDLFFALRGGGGGTFGVVMKVTTRALPRAELVTVSALFKPTTSIQKFLEFVIPYSVGWAEDGWSGYIYTAGIFHMTKLETTEDDALAYMAPLKTFLAEELHIEMRVSTSHSYGDFHEKPKCIPVFPTSRLIPGGDLLRVTQGASEHHHSSLQTRQYAFPGDGKTSVTDAWRRSIWDVTFGQVWDYSASPDEQEKAYRDLSRSMDPLRAITPGGGAYGNEADVYEPDWQRAFWGEHYEELVRVKGKYDSEHLLDCWRCVDWKGASDPRYHCYF